MKKLFGLLCVGCLAFAAAAQKTYSVTGRILDAERHEPLPAAAVLMQNLVDSTRYWAITTEKGYFEVSVPAGRYAVIIRMLGYRSDTLHWDVQSDRYWGTIMLRPSAVALKEATVSASAEKVSVDREAYIITDSLRKQAASAREVLEKLPGMSYLPHTDELRLDGDAHILLLVNGMEKDARYIKNLPPERIRKVEIQRNPAGRYGLEGYSAVINVILFEDYRGVQLNASQMTALSPSRKYNEFPIVNTNGWLQGTYAAGPHSWHAALYNYAGWVSLRKLDERRLSDGWMQMRPPDDAFSGRYDFWNASGQLDWDFFPADGHQINVEWAFESPLMPVLDSSRYLLTFPDSTEIGQVNVSVDQSQDHTLTGRYHARVSPRAELRAQLQQQWGHDESRTTIRWMPGGTYQEQRRRTESNTSLYVEGDYALGRYATFSGGYAHKAFHRNEAVEQGRDGFPFVADSFPYRRRVHQLYGYFGYQRKGWGVKVGSALEAVTMTYDSLPQYYSVMPAPAVDVMWNPHPMLSIKAQYRGQIAYPTLTQLNPVRTQLDALIFQEGNPMLRPAYEHRTSLALRALRGALRLEPYWNETPRYIALDGRLNGDTLILQYEHAGRFREWGVKGNLGLPLGLPGLVFFANGRWYRQSLTTSGQTHTISDWFGQMGVVYSYAPWNLQTGAIYMKNGMRRITPLGYTTSSGGIAGMLLFVRKDFGPKRQWQLTAFYFPPIEPIIDYSNPTYQQVAHFERFQDIQFPGIIDAFGFRLTYNFHKGRVRKISTRLVAPEEHTPEQKKKGGFF